VTRRGVVLVTMEGRRPDMPEYPLLPGDILRYEEGSWWKVAPGLAIGGFILSDDDVGRLAEQTNERWVLADGLGDYLNWCASLPAEDADV
jgi:hypothetical protein